MPEQLEVFDALVDERPRRLVGVCLRRDVVYRSSRLSVLFRLLLALPHFALISLVAVLVDLALPMGWIVALITGRLPRWTHAFLSWTLRYSLRVNAYLHLLTDQWPTVGDRPYPVVLDLPERGKLNRATVLFRLLLIGPAGLLLWLVSYGLLVVSPLIWLLVLVISRVPRVVFDASAVWLRYQTRCASYFCLLTGAYPSGLFRQETEPIEGASISDPMPPRLTRGVRVMLAGFMTITMGFSAVDVAVAAGRAPKEAALESRAIARQQLAAAYNNLYLGSPACSSNASRLDCLQTYDEQAESAVSGFVDRVAGISFPVDMRSDVESLFFAAEGLDYGLQELDKANSQAEYDGTLQMYDVRGYKAALIRDYKLILGELQAPR